MNISDIQNAIDNIVHGGKPKIISPMAKASNQAFNIADQIKATNPSASNISYQSLLGLSQKFGNQLLPDVNAIKGAVSKFAQPEQAQAATFDPNQPVPSGTGSAMKYIASQTPGGQDPTKYYKAFQDPNFLPKIAAADSIKPGLSNLLLLQAFHESTLGNASNNIFGNLPGGEGSGKTAAFASPSDAIDYQLGPNVLGGGANKNMDIVNDKNPLTLGRVQQLYQSYNPEGSYIDSMLQTLGGKN